MRVCKCFKFDAAHKLPEYAGKCANMHGHCWKVEIELSGNVDNTTGMVLDFSELKAIINPIIEKLDHHYLNDIIPNPTAENIVTWFRWELAVSTIHAKLTRIRIYETEDSFAEWSRWDATN